ncbi:MAG: tetratricopeptide repeat protein [Victivallaceae bacterium]|nr:tetratricopeptide repeat protein [Victivallaceae bacterium]
MFKKLLIFSFMVSFFGVVSAQEDYAAGWKAAIELYRAKKYAEALPAFEKLTKTAPSLQAQYECYRHAGYSARNIKKYDEAIALADKIAEIPNPYPYYSKLRRMEFMYNAGKYQDIIARFKIDDIKKWPADYKVEALHYLGLAYYQLKQGKEAEKIFKLGKENAVSPYWSGLHSLRNGHNYRHRLKDMDKAATAFQEVIDNPDASIWHKCEACSGIADILSYQKKYEEALAECNKLLMLKKIPGYWIARGLAQKAGILKTMGKKDEAVKCYEQAVATKGCPAWLTNSCLNQLKALQPKTK